MRPGSLSLWERGTAKRWSGWRRYDITHTDTFPSKERPTFDENVVSICYALPPTPFPPLTRSPFPVGEGCCTRNLRQQMKRFHLSQKKDRDLCNEGNVATLPVWGNGKVRGSPHSEIPMVFRKFWKFALFQKLKLVSRFCCTVAIRSGNRPSCGGCDGDSCRCSCCSVPADAEPTSSPTRSSSPERA